MTADFISIKSTPDLAFISQHLFTAILWVNDELSISWLNAQAEQLLAISSGRLLNQSVLMLLAPEELTTKNSTIIDSPKDKNCSLTERFHHAKQYQQPFIDHDHLINSPLNGNLPLSIDYSVTPVSYQQQSYFIIEMWGKDRQSRISEEQRQQQHLFSQDSLENNPPQSQHASSAQNWQHALAIWAKQALQAGTTDILQTATPEFERVLLTAALHHSGGKKIAAANLLGWGRNTLTRKLQLLDVSPYQE